MLLLQNTCHRERLKLNRTIRVASKTVTMEIIPNEHFKKFRATQNLNLTKGYVFHMALEYTCEVIHAGQVVLTCSWCLGTITSGTEVPPCVPIVPISEHSYCSVNKILLVLRNVLMDK